MAVLLLEFMYKGDCCSAKLVDTEVIIESDVTIAELMSVFGAVVDVYTL